ncbi:MAG TPA: hypothetical protein VKM54_19785, partial [Myxococcota bacterium]|nr:hypothetical protein [Myxococcota bacterium]
MRLKLLQTHFDPSSSAYGISAADVEAWKERELARGPKRSSVNLSLPVLRAAFRYGVEVELIEKAPRIKPLREPTSLLVA